MISKENILASYFNIRDISNEYKTFIQKYPLYFNEVPTKPNNFSLDNLSKRSDNNSICSALSRIEIDKTIYNDILNNRKKYNVFVEITTEEADDKIWLFINERTELEGPYSSKEMDTFFKNNTLTETTKVKKKIDENFVALSMILKRFYKKTVNNLLKEKTYKRTTFSKFKNIKNNVVDNNSVSDNHSEISRKDSYIRNKSTSLNNDFTVDSKSGRHKTTPFIGNPINEEDEGFVEYDIV